MAENNNNPTTLQQAQAAANSNASQYLNDIEKRHREMQDRMEETLRFRTFEEQRRLESAQLLQNYYPEYGVEPGFGVGIASGMSSAALGYGGLRFAQARGKGVLGTAIYAGIGAATGYTAGRIISEEQAGTSTSLTGLYNQNRLNTFGAPAAYVARQGWQTMQGSVLPPELLQSSVIAPANNIATSWGLNPEQFLPGAMDLMSAGIVAPADSMKGRSMVSALKDAAEIFKGVQAFFGSVDIRGITEKIKIAQQAGFTPEGMTSLGRAMQSSSMAFAPEEVRAQMFSAAVQYGNALNQQGVSAHLGGVAAVHGFGTAYNTFGMLSNYDKTRFKTTEGLANSITGIYASQMANPLLVLGAGDAQRGINALGNFDMTSAKGMREFRRTVYEVSANLGLREQRKQLDNSVESRMEMMGIDDRETAAEYVLGDPDKARAYMVDYENRGLTLEKNAALFKGRMSIAGSSRREGDLRNIINDAMKGGYLSVGANKFLNSGSQQAAMVRFQMRGRAYDSAAINVDDMLQSTSAWGFWDPRALARLKKSSLSGSKEFLSENLLSVVDGDVGEHMAGVLAAKDPNAAASIAYFTTEVQSGYDEAAGSPDSMDAEMKAAVGELSQAGASTFISRLQEEPGVYATPEKFSELAAKSGFSNIAKVTRNPRNFGKFLRYAERVNKESAATISRTTLGVTSVRADIFGAKTTPIFSATKGLAGSQGFMGKAGAVLSNPAITVGVAGTAALAVGIGAGVAGTPAMGLAAAWKTFKIVGAGMQIAGAAISATDVLSSSSGIDPAAAADLDRNFYGEEVVISTILALLPDKFFDTTAALTQSDLTNRQQMVNEIANTLYGGLYNSKVNKRKKEEAFKAVEDGIQKALAGEILEDIGKEFFKYLLSEGRGKLYRAMQVIWAYLEANTDPVEPSIIIQRCSERSGQNGFWIKSTPERQKLVVAKQVIMSNKTSLGTLTDRASTSYQDAQKRDRIINDTAADIKKLVTKDGKAVTRVDTNDILEKVRNVVTNSTKEERGNISTLGKKVEEDLKNSGFTIEAGAGEKILAAFEGNITKSESISEVSNKSLQILKTILADNEVKKLVGDILGKALATGKA